MGTVFKKQYTKPLPKGAEVLTQEGKTIARWKPAKGRHRDSTCRQGQGRLAANPQEGRDLYSQVPQRAGDRRREGHRLPGRRGRQVGADGA